MKVLVVVDSLKDINKKINTLTSRFGGQLHFVVKAEFVKLFNTFGYQASAVYSNNLTEIMHYLLKRMDISDVVIYYSSLELTNELANTFISAVDDGSKVVNIVPNYNYFERFGNSVYSLYVKTIFKANDSFASPKLQFLPAGFVEELLSSHLGNKLFEINKELCTTINTSDKVVNSSLKVKTKFNKYAILPIIALLAITALFIMCLGVFGAKFIVIFLFVVLYILDIVLTIIFQCKNYFDARFLK